MVILGKDNTMTKAEQWKEYAVKTSIESIGLMDQKWSDIQTIKKLEKRNTELRVTNRQLRHQLRQAKEI